MATAIVASTMIMTGAIDCTADDKTALSRTLCAAFLHAHADTHLW